MDARKLLRRQENASRRRKWLLVALAVMLGIWLYDTNATPWRSVNSAVASGYVKATDWAITKARQALGASANPHDSIAMAHEVARRVKTSTGRRRTIRWPAREVQCLALAVYHEAGGDSREAQLGIVQIALNRLNPKSDSKRKPDKSICAVVYRGLNLPLGCLFKQTCRKIGAIPADGATWRSALATATEALAVEGDAAASLVTATHFVTDGDKPAWFQRLHEVDRIGRFVFLTDTPTEAMIARANRQQALRLGSNKADEIETDEQADRRLRTTARASRRPSPPPSRAEPAADLSAIFNQ